jgi:hypothetical protein
VKRLLLVLVLSLVAIPMFILPAAANGAGETITTLPATHVLESTATLNATAINAGKRTFQAYFEYGRVRGTYNLKTPPVLFVGVGSFTLNADLTKLFSCTKYYARAVMSEPMQTNYIYGNVITFTTTGCPVGPLGQNTIPGTSSVGTPYTASSLSPAQMSNIVVQSAAIATPKVGPGEKVDITASVTNKGTSNGDAKVTLYVNGQEVESKGITLSSGQTSPLHFFVSRDEPGTYTVTVGGVSAGSFTVDTFTNNDLPIYIVIAVVTLGIAGALYLFTRKRTA